jgi:tRNA-specific 2-thiouridylase
VASPGEVVDEQGAVVGAHHGYWGFTPGQRKGLGVATGTPLYAVKTVPQRNQVVVGPQESLARRTVRADGKLHVDVARADVKLRYRSPAVPGKVEPVSRGFRVDLEEPVYGVATGQAAVLYEGDVVVGAGRVTSSSR